MRIYLHYVNMSISPHPRFSPLQLRQGVLNVIPPLYGRIADEPFRFQHGCHGFLIRPVHADIKWKTSRPKGLTEEDIDGRGQIDPQFSVQRFTLLLDVMRTLKLVVGAICLPPLFLLHSASIALQYTFNRRIHEKLQQKHFT